MEQGSGPADTPSTYQARYPLKPTSWAKVESTMIEINKNFNSLGEFLSLLFHNRDYAHRSAVSAFLHGNWNVTMATIIPLVYHHRASKPKTTSSDADDKLDSFEPNGVLPA
ncbi:hypothetical protein FIBSPDRAFT_1051397 [Athelia psychrophila]|uniref:Uncharacterized protein n=1 Tax=Athelia psychrophila TaxID=1759441 RepID=A0A165Z871_9AGAM|nr:hypothetical protein FIBSPDRAFT_1051397 [Fibularhizoctonia sp. CBS 109695]